MPVSKLGIESTGSIMHRACMDNEGHLWGGYSSFLPPQADSSSPSADNSHRALSSTDTARTTKPPVASTPLPWRPFDKPAALRSLSPSLPCSPPTDSPNHKRSFESHLCSRIRTAVISPLLLANRRSRSFLPAQAPDSNARFSPAGPIQDAQASPLARNKATPPCRNFIATLPTLRPLSLFSNAP